MVRAGHWFGHLDFWVEVRLTNYQFQTIFQDIFWFFIHFIQQRSRNKSYHNNCLSRCLWATPTYRTCPIFMRFSRCQNGFTVKYLIGFQYKTLGFVLLSFCKFQDLSTINNLSLHCHLRNQTYYIPHFNRFDLWW